jgi:uncharacterized phiE125 gp8 family phage protein
MTYRLLTGPAALPVTLAEAKTHLRIDGNDLDAVVTNWIAGVTAYAEHKTARACIHQTWRITHDRFPSAIRVPRAPVVSVTALKFWNEQNVETLLDPADYELDAESEPGWIVPAVGKAWPSTVTKINAVRIDVLCGYGAASTAVPAGLRLYLLAKLVEQFDAGSELTKAGIAPSFIDRQLDPYLLEEFG